MTSRFENLIIPWIFEKEGVKYENDPDDPGGPTKFGIDQRSHPKENIRALTANRAMEIYWNEYWIKNNCDKYSPPMDWILFNCCVNCGAGREKQFLNVSGSDPIKFLDEQQNYYVGLADRRPTSRKYLRGWIKRLDDLAVSSHTDWHSDPKLRDKYYVKKI